MKVAPTKRAMGSHQSAKMISEVWLTPRYILEPLGDFDLDPCAATSRPWPTARKHYTKEDNGLLLPWEGRVWCNPPYGLQAAKWLQKCAAHKNAIALVFARTETAMFFDWVWPHASALLFIRGRLHFCHANGIRAKANSGAPSVLIAYGEENAGILRSSGIRGAFVGAKDVI